jgi:hypothetical protein
MSMRDESMEIFESFHRGGKNIFQLVESVSELELGIKLTGSAGDRVL